ncbi:MAG: hypothetical protein ACLPTF_23520, partial [Steroidobacteraceae bacterium]
MRSAENAFAQGPKPHAHIPATSARLKSCPDTKPPRIYAGRSFSAAGLAALLLLAGCKPVGPNYQRPGYTAPPAYKEAGASSVQAPLPPPENPAGGAWQPATPSDGMLKGKWWEVYQDPQLNQLEERIAHYNQGLRGALETYLAAQDQVRAAHAAFYPMLSAGPWV